VNQNVVDWLPMGAVTSDAVRVKLEGAVDDWSRRWFARTSVGVGAVRSRAPGALGEDWRIPHQIVAVSHTPRALARLANWALDARLDLLEPTETDRQLVGLFEPRLLDDLVSSVEDAIGGPQQMNGAAPDWSRLGGVEISLADSNGGALLTLAIPLTALLPLTKASLPARTRPRTGLEPIGKALHPTVVTVEASLGVAHVTLDELRGLSPGDVLVLDRRIDQGVELTLAGVDGPLARAGLSELEGRLALILQA